MSAFNRFEAFTLIEFTIVLIIVSILSVFVFSSWQGDTISLEGQAQQIANDLRYTQALAMTRGERFRWVRISTNTYQIQNNAGTAVMLARGSGTVTLMGGITFGSFTNLPNNLVAFDGLGVPYTDTSSPGTALSSAASISITLSGQTKSIVVTPETGRVVVQ